MTAIYSTLQQDQRTDVCWGLSGQVAEPLNHINHLCRFIAADRKYRWMKIKGKKFIHYKKKQAATKKCDGARIIIKARPVEFIYMELVDESPAEM